jgi:hypothetical protein
MGTKEFNMKYFVFLTLAFSFKISSAATLSCDLKINDQVMTKKSVQTTLDQKTPIGNAQEIYAYVTEKKENYYVVEAFLASYEVRIYGEGFIKQENDFVKAALWGREILTEIKCSPR